MASDPREDVLLEWRWDLQSMEPFDADPPEKVLRGLDAADPLRAMLGDALDKLEAIVPHIGMRLFCSVCESYSNECGCHPNVAQRMAGPIRDLLTRLRKLTPTEGGAG